MKSIQSALVAVAAVMLAACAQPPTADIDAANSSLDQARTAQAETYAPEAWTAANDAKTSLEAELNAQQGKMAALRSYDKAKSLASDMKSAADRAKQDAATGKDKAKTDADTLMTQAREERDRAKTALSSAPKGKGTEADLASLKSDEQGIDDTLADMQRAYDSGDYIGAKNKAQAAISSAQQIEKEIDAAKSRRHAV